MCAQCNSGQFHSFVTHTHTHTLSLSFNGHSNGGTYHTSINAISHKHLIEKHLLFIALQRVATAKSGYSEQMREENFGCRTSLLPKEGRLSNLVVNQAYSCGIACFHGKKSYLGGTLVRGINHSKNVTFVGFLTNVNIQTVIRHNPLMSEHKTGKLGAPDCDHTFADRLPSERVSR